MALFRSLFFIFAIILVALGGGYLLWVVTRPAEPLSLELQTPKLAMAQMDQGLRAKPLFFTVAAVPYVKEHWQEWSGAYGLPTPLPEEIAVLCDATLQSPKDWHVLDRRWHFGAILLTGDPATFRPLLDHLRKSPEWTLTRLDPTSLVFERGATRAWTPADVAPLLAVFATHPAVEQKMARYLIAHRLMYLNEMPAAKALLDEVIKTEPQSKEAWTEMAQWYGMQEKWHESAMAAERAVATDCCYHPAQRALAQANYALGNFEKALDATRALYALAPGDMPTLLLHAKTTHEAHAFGEEIEVLQKLISLFQGNAQPVGSWQIYLGQAYAATGNGATAKDQFKMALKDTTLTQSQREFTLQAIDKIETKPDFFNTGQSLPPSSLLDAPAYRP